MFIKNLPKAQKATINKFISVALELGGKDPAYVRHDADIEKTVENLVDGSFFNSGQSCCGIERIYVDKKIYNKFFFKYVVTCICSIIHVNISSHSFRSTTGVS